MKILQQRFSFALNEILKSAYKYTYTLKVNLLQYIKHKVDTQKKNTSFQYLSNPKLKPNIDF